MEYCRDAEEEKTRDRVVGREMETETSRGKRARERVRGGGERERATAVEQNARITLIFMSRATLPAAATRPRTCTAMHRRHTEPTVPYASIYRDVVDSDDAHAKLTLSQKTILSTPR